MPPMCDSSTAVKYLWRENFIFREKTKISVERKNFDRRFMGSTSKISCR